MIRGLCQTNFWSEETLKALELSEEELRREDWRKVQEQGFESFTQAFGRALFKMKAEGLIARSARSKNGINIAYFPENKLPGSKVQLWEAEELHDLTLE